MGEPLKEIIQPVIEIAERASRSALSYFRQPILIEIKENQTPVTIADRKTEEKIRRELEQGFPDFGILGEEFGEVTKSNDYVWTIDPIDGTRSFIRGIPLFGTLVGLLEKGKPVLGVMVLPCLNETYSAYEGGGTFCNGIQTHVSSTAALESAIVCHSDVNLFEDSGKLPMLQKLIDQSELLRGYTDCFGHSLVVRGSADAMIDPVISIWDVAPIACLVKEAGGAYFDFEGSETITSRSFVACGPALKAQILDLV